MIDAHFIKTRIFAFEVADLLEVPLKFFIGLLAQCPRLSGTLLPAFQSFLDLVPLEVIRSLELDSL